LKEAETYLKKHGIIIETTAPYSQQSNGIVEGRTTYSLRW